MALTISDRGRRLCATLCVLCMGSLLRADPCVPRWSGEFPLDNGVVGMVRALAVFDDGTGPALYVGGQIAGVGGMAVNNIARWDGKIWKPLGTGTDGVDNTVWALAVFDDGSGPALYVGGDFVNAGGLPANHLAKWDGSSWSAVGAGTNGGVYAFAAYDDGSGHALYLGGIFTDAGGVSASRIARWRSGTFSAVGAGVSDGIAPPMVRALAVFDGGSGPRLYAGGLFTIPGKNIASWNGTSWSTLGSGASNVVNALAVYDDGGGHDLYVGGGFTSAGGVVNCRRVARWDGSNWSALGMGLTDSTVHTLGVFNDGNGTALYVAGQFTKATLPVGYTEVRRIAKWDGSAWEPLEGGLLDDTRNPCWCDPVNCNCGPRPAVANTLAVFDGGLYVGGDFVNVLCHEAFNLVRWQCPLPGASRADLDQDDDVDLDDFERFVGCFTGANVGGVADCCASADFDSDGDVDQDDFGVHQRCYAGPDVLPPAGCDP